MPTWIWSGTAVTEVGREPGIKGVSVFVSFFRLETEVLGITQSYRILSVSLVSGSLMHISFIPLGLSHISRGCQCIDFGEPLQLTRKEKYMCGFLSRDCSCSNFGFAFVLIFEFEGEPENRKTCHFNCFLSNENEPLRWNSRLEKTWAHKSGPRFQSVPLTPPSPSSSLSCSPSPPCKWVILNKLMQLSDSCFFPVIITPDY